MGRLRKYRKKVRDHSGIVYVLKIKLEDRVVYKIGVTTKTVVKRTLQIIEGVFKEYGYFPEICILRENTTKNHFKVETALHNILCDNKYMPANRFTGSTELFSGISEEKILKNYELVINSDEPAEIDKRIFKW